MHHTFYSFKNIPSNKRDILLQQIDREEKERQKTNHEIEFLNARL